MSPVLGFFTSMLSTLWRCHSKLIGAMCPFIGILNTFAPFSLFSTFVLTFALLLGLLALAAVNRDSDRRRGGPLLWRDL